MKRDIGVGLFVLAAVAILAGGYLYSSRLHYARGARTYLMDVANVGGLEEGAAVVMGGFRVGEVRSIEVRPRPFLHFTMELHVREDVALPEGTIAVITSQAITGGRTIELRPPTDPGEGMLKAGDLLASELDPSLADVIARADRVFRDLEHVASSLRYLTESEEEGTLKDAIHSLDGAVADLGSAARRADRLLADVEKTVAVVAPELERGTTMFAATMEDARGAAAQVSELVRRESPGVHAALDAVQARLDDVGKLLDGYQPDRLEDLGRALANLERASADLAELMAALKRSPWHTIRKGVPEEAPAGR